MAQIYVRKLYADQGKFGMEYKIQATDGNYYQSSKPFMAGVEEGAAIEVETKPQTKPSKYFHIKSYKLLANPNSVSQTQPAGQGQAVSPPPKPLPAKPLEKALPKLTPELQAKWLRDIERALKLVGEDPAMNDRLQAEMMRQYFSEWMSERITAEQKARWGK